MFKNGIITTLNDKEKFIEKLFKQAEQNCMNENQIQEIIKSQLNARTNKECPRCDSVDFLISGRINLNTFKKTDQSKITEFVLPAVIVICDKCGFISLHAQGTLGLYTFDNI